MQFWVRVRVRVLMDFTSGTVVEIGTTNFKEYPTSFADRLFRGVFILR